MGLLTDVQIRHWVKAGEPIAKSDGDGLTFTLSKGGTAAWVLRYRLAGKQKEKTIGRFPDVSLKMAREIAAEDRVKVQQGIDVAREKQIDKRESASAWTVRQLAADYESKVLAGLAPATIASRHQKIRDYVLPSIGSLAAKDVTGADVVQMLEKVADKSPKLVKSCLSAARLVLAHGLSKHILAGDPCAGISVAAIAGQGAKGVRDRVMLSDVELKAVLPTLAQYGRINELTVRILLSTAVRIQALMLAEWSHIDFTAKTWTIPPGDGRKSDREFVVPLPDVVAGYFAELQVMSGNSRFVLPILKKMKGKESDDHMRQQTINEMLHRLCDGLAGKVRPFTPHDLRSSARSHFSVLGVPVTVAERCLNHSLGGLIAIYDQHDYLDERRRALEMWCAKLAVLESGADNVVVINRTA
ncbi:site-specific integrase [Dechloromonas sp. TW-R-39-2]|uniref:tyrosine-type recombinase/integrase n=1 Tax=Dechloromonas sp. TW-R-39-2 TaxID=2654218 RepID=UPI00193E310F|nr:site-specific integrase [Dechloromonas sp. TW-R-39-2]